jgi:iron complex outermembrane receptor protein
MSTTNPLAVAALALSSLPLQASAQATLPPVNVTATRFSDDADKLPLGVSVITAKDIADSGVSTVNEAIMKLLGVPGRQDLYGGGNYALDLRGFGETALSNQVIVVDGQRVNEGDLSTPFLASLPIGEIERIEVLRGSGAVLYGEGATGGVVVITTKAGAGGARRTGGQVYGALGNDRLREGRASATFAAGGFSLDAAASRRATDNHRDNFQSRTEAQSIGAQWQHANVRVGATVAHDDLDGGLPGSLSAAQYAQNPRQSNTPNDHGDIRNDRFTGFARVTLGDWELAFDAGKRHKELRSRYVSAGYAYDYDVDAENYGLRAKHQASFGGVQNALVVGVDVNNWYRETLGAFGSKSLQHATGYYVKDDVTLPSATRLSAGFRTTKIDKTDGFNSIDDRQKAWEFGALQPIGTALSVYARYGRSFRLPNVDEIGYTLNGASLLPQSSRDAELGGRWSQGATRAELPLYRHSLTNEIGYDGTVNNFFGANINFDPTLRRGVEAELAHDWTSTLKTRVIGALRRATFREGAHEGKDVPLTPRKTLALRADWQVLPNQQLNGMLNYVASQHPDYDNACRMPAHVTADLRYAYQWGAAQWSLGVANVTDRKYYTQAYSCVGGTVSSIYPEAGRQFTTAVRWGF